MAKRLTQRQKRMAAIILRMQDFMRDYDQQIGGLDYPDHVFIDDVLYGLGVALDPDAHMFALGFDAWRAKLMAHLERNIDESRVLTTSMRLFARELRRDPAKAQELFQRAGIVGPDGKLTAQYRAEE